MDKKGRILMKNLKDNVNEEVVVKGWVDTRRDHGKLIFLTLRDRTSSVQAVIHAGNESVFEKVSALKEEFVVAVEGLVKARPEKMVNDKEENGDLELEILDVEILSHAHTLPFDKDAELNIETHLDNLPLTLRKKHISAIFKVQSEIVKAFREYLIENDFTEFQSPAIVGGDAEGGAGVFELSYFKDRKAYLATSPQLYKQMLVGIFERVFATGKVFRAEKHATTRHLSEYTSMDFEMGFIDSYTDVMKILEGAIRHIVYRVNENTTKELELLGTSFVSLPDTDFPVLTLKEAQEIIYQEDGRDNRGEPDLEPEDERFLCKWAKENHNSDFIFITHYPVSKRPFYTKESSDDTSLTNSFDLLFRGVEISTGGQREHDYDKLIEKIKNKGLDPEKFEFYLQAFKYGIPPHGGIGMGLERLTAKICGVSNVKEATLFPRDMTRIDLPLSDNE